MQQSSDLYRNKNEKLISTGILRSNCIYNIYAEYCNEFLIENIKAGSAGSWFFFLYNGKHWFNTLPPDIKFH